MLGVVLAGGESRRMGRDKALLDWGGEPLWKRQVAVLRAAGASRVVVGRRAGQAPIAYPDCCLDVFSDSGPLAGLHAALSIGGHPLVAVLAVDMVGIDAAWFEWLAALCRPGVGAAARHARSLEPLAAIYPSEALPEAAARLSRGELSVRGLVLGLEAAGMMSVVEVPEAYAARVESVNAPPA
jgi:molybdopterin-guanine dinucleotide biosynthesis protein A